MPVITSPALSTLPAISAVFCATAASAASMRLLHVVCAEHARDQRDVARRRARPAERQIEPRSFRR